MSWILSGIILLQALLFFFQKKNGGNKNSIIITAIGMIALLLGARYMMKNVAIMWGIFGIAHILLIILYLYNNHTIIKEINSLDDLKQVLEKYVQISTIFYVIPFSMLIVALFSLGNETDGIVPIVVCAILSVFASLYNLKENKSIDNFLKERNNFILKKSEKNVYRKNTLLLIYMIDVSMAAGMLYSATFSGMREGVVAIIFVIELLVNLIVYLIYYQYVKKNFLKGDFSEYSKWQIFVPKKVGIGYTFNFYSPFSHLLILVGAIVLIIYLVRYN